MTTYFITRHEGAKHWAIQQGFSIDVVAEHLEISAIQSGDIILGTLPINLVEKLCRMGASYFHLSLHIPPEFRGKELSVEQMETFGAKLQQFNVQKVENGGKQHGAT